MFAEAARQITRQDDPLVRTLESLYAKSMDVARGGDVEAYFRYRTRASRDRPPKLTRALLPLFADMLPPLAGLKFVRMDSAAGMARALYRWPREDIARYTVLVYRREDGEWKIDAVSVRTDGVTPRSSREAAPGKRTTTGK